MSDRIVIQGPGYSAYRLEIHDFVKDKKLFTLYIRALQSLQDVAEEKDQSFFGVGGIHGLPYAPWNNAQGSFEGNTDPNWTFGGYCTHGTVIFPTWHRPYVLLYEQLLQSLATKIADQFQVDREQWAQVARQLRQPYWDWTQYSLPPDEVIRDSTVIITGFDGKDVSVENPLLRYKFKASLPLPYFQDTSFANWQTTLRHPDDNGNENIDEMVQVLTDAHAKTRRDVFFLMSFVRDWDGFSNHTSSENSITNSLESIHDNLHTQIGGSGQMGDPAVAGFDPIFFLHHCNVDRLLSFWYIVHNVWVSRGDGPIEGAFYLPPNTTVDNNTDLSPFWNSATDPTFWKSTEVTTTAGLGYTYADFKGIDVNDRNAVRKKVLDIVREYSQPGRAQASRALGSTQHAPTILAALGNAGPKPSGARSLDAVASNPHPPAHNNPHPPAHNNPHPPTHNNPQSTEPSTHTAQGNLVNNWTIRIRVKQYELGRSFSVLIFMGPVPEDSTQWLTSPNLVGVEHSFVNSAAFSCDNCRRQADTVSESFIHINDFIASHYPELASYNEDVIKPHLKEHLSWKVIDTSGKPVELSSLEVTVLVFPLSWEIGAELPTAREIEYHHDITRGKPGGMPSEA